MKKILDEFLTAVGFLSRIPVKSDDLTVLSTNYFPAVGFLLGTVLSMILLLLKNIFPVRIASFLLIIFYIYLTGAVHLDGTADFLDGFFAGRSRKKTIEIMHDSNTGVFAVIGLILIIFYKYLLFLELFSADNLIFFIIFPVLSRFILTIIIRKNRVAEESIMAKNLHNNSEDENIWIAGISTFLFLMTLFIFFGFSYFIKITAALIAAFLTAVFIAKKAKKKIGGLTGDIYGTIVEVSEIIILTVFIIF